LERSPQKVVEELNDELIFPESAEKVYGVVTSRSESGSYVLDSAATERRRAEIRKERLARAVPTREFLARAREDVIAGNFATIVKEMYNDSFKNSPRFLKEYREFWNLPETFVGF
jgi:acetone carboxylase alpha subunit